MENKTKQTTKQEDKKLYQMFEGKSIKYNGLYQLDNDKTGIGLLVDNKLILVEVQRGDK